MDKVSYVGNADVNAIDHLYQQYRQDPTSVDHSWAKFFEGFEFAQTNFEQDGAIPENFVKEFKVINLINGYRTRGHLFTKTNPVRDRRKHSPNLEITHFGLSDQDLNDVFQAGEQIGIGAAKLSDIIAHLELTYCQSIGIEYMYMRDPERIDWFRNKIELNNRPVFDPLRKKKIYEKLNQATGFEAFLGKKFVGQKRFSIEGGEGLIPALDTLVRKGAALGVEYFVMGMAHRGRLNTLANIFEKRPRDIFREFEGKEFDFETTFDGDVKYHQGFTSHIVLDNGQQIGLTLAPNPSHLEAVSTVVEGIARAKIDHVYQTEDKVCPVLIHGDAAIAGQGIVYETIQMAGLDGYRTGGTIHIVVNNQVGFTTNYLDGRTSTYCTDVAKTTLCPVFHVNGDDIEAVVTTIEIAMEYRQAFHRDIFIDLLCYRKYGHNEGDEPKFTQPKLYNIIAKHPNPREIYLEQLQREALLTAEEAKQIEQDYQQFLEEEYEQSRSRDKALVYDFLSLTWEDYRHGTAQDFEKSPQTGIAKNELLKLGRKLSTLPEGKKYFRKIAKIFEDRLQAIENDKLDWGSAEMLAYATLLAEGHAVRISGSVQKPQSMPYSPDLKLKDVLLMAGGKKPSADLNRVEIFRLNYSNKRGSGYERIVLKLDTNYNILGRNADFTLLPFDQILVRDLLLYNTTKQVEVAGEVKYPGTYPMPAKIYRLSDLIAEAGGLNALASKELAVIYRSANDVGPIGVDLKKALRHKRSSKRNPVLMSGDVVSILPYQNTFAIRLEGTQYPQIDTVKVERMQFVYQGKKSARWYIREYAGGFAPDADKRSVAVAYPSGQVDGNKRVLYLFNDMPTVQNGGEIVITMKEKEKTEKEKKEVDFDAIFSRSFQAISSILTITLLLKQL